MDNIKLEISEKYLDYVLTHNKQPESVYAFCKEIGISEKEFYDQYSSFQQISERIWTAIFQQTTTNIEAEDIYQSYSVREKMLALYYSLLENLKNKRSFVLFSLKKYPINWLAESDVLVGTEENFKNFVQNLIREGIDSKEVADRPFLTERYQKFLWLQFVFILNYWQKDTSQSFERTDAAVEKAVNLGLDLIGTNVADSAFDFVRFYFGKN
ncbi:MAG: TetR/AcrR family transcriptional regulator [Bacteroidetes bacterium]|nr:MAG: TetR/AcrR family transcriptional regulator [Bacteroidota bacterium]